jgi:cell wall-associated NlpC family hydrolase
MMKKFLAICWLLFVGVLAGRGEDDTLNHAYQSLSRFGNHVRNAFAEDSDDRPSPTPRRHRKSTAKHSSSKKAATEDSDSGNASPTPPAKSKSAAQSSTEEKQGTPRTADGEGKSDSNPSGTPAGDQGAGSDGKNKSETAAPMATIKPEELREFSEQPAEVQRLIRNSLLLTEQNLSYQYGSADPAAGGMDCSGFIYYVLRDAGYKDVPRDSAGQYEWVRKIGNFHAVLSRSGGSFELNDLKPGDLLFWSGTYKVDRDIPITHVMIYLGKQKSNDKPVMVGATDGRSYDGVRRYGVSVFDFKMPSGKPNTNDPDLTAKFEGYASIPGLRGVNVESKNQEKPEQGIKEDKGPAKAKEKSSTNELGEGD